jgi:hypothetical protein
MDELMDELTDKLAECSISTKNSKSGGAQTNINGLSFEVKTELQPVNNISHVKKGQLFKYLDKYLNKTISMGHGCRKPDECFVDIERKIIFIIEKKFQKVSGSVCEKIQTVDFKLWQYRRCFLKFSIIYIYCLSSWFKENCVAELEYLKLKNIPIFWGDDASYKKDILDFIGNYELSPPLLQNQASLS